MIPYRCTNTQVNFLLLASNLMKMKKPFELSPELVGKFEVINTTLPVLHSRIGHVDFRTMTFAQAEELVAAGTDYLKRVGSTEEQKEK